MRKPSGIPYLYPTCTEIGFSYYCSGVDHYDDISSHKVDGQRVYLRNTKDRR